MQLFNTPPKEASFLLRALKTIAMANHDFAEAEKALLQTAAKLYSVFQEGEALSLINADELAENISEVEDRKRLLSACVVMALADEEATKEEWKLLDEFRQAFGLSEDSLKQEYEIVLAQRQLAQKEMQRRQMASVLREVYNAQGQKGLALFFHTKSGHSIEDPSLSYRYRKLGLLPKNTLGREFWNYCRKNEFGLPGETGGLPVHFLYHDLLHVVTGYSIKPEGEFQLGAFIAGMKQCDPFAFLFFVLLETQKEMNFSEKLFSQALLRGKNCQTDLSHNWNIWEDFSKPLDTLRILYTIE